LPLEPGCALALKKLVVMLKMDFLIVG